MRAARYDVALKQVDKALKMRPDDQRTLLLRGHIYRKQRRLKEASDDYKRAVELNPDDPRARAFLGGLQRIMGDLTGAKDNIMHALKLDAMNVEARISLGKIYEKGKALTGAKREYEKAIELVPADERGYVALAVLLIENPTLKDKHDKVEPRQRAKELLDKALTLNPSFAETSFLLAVMATPEDPEQGMEFLERAVKNGFKDRKRLRDKAFAKLESRPQFKNLLKVFGA
jgi:Tfp pilus assembly protein PilF